MLRINEYNHRILPFTTYDFDAPENHALRRQCTMEVTVVMKLSVRFIGEIIYANSFSLPIMASRRVFFFSFFSITLRPPMLVLPACPLHQFLPMRAARAFETVSTTELAMMATASTTSSFELAASRAVVGACLDECGVMSYREHHREEQQQDTSWPPRRCCAKSWECRRVGKKKHLAHGTWFAFATKSFSLLGEKHHTIAASHTNQNRVRFGDECRHRRRRRRWRTCSKVEVPNEWGGHDDDDEFMISWVVKNLNTKGQAKANLRVRSE